GGPLEPLVLGAAFQTRDARSGEVDAHLEPALADACAQVARVELIRHRPVSSPCPARSSATAPATSSSEKPERSTARATLASAKSRGVTSPSRTRCSCAAPC